MVVIQNRRRLDKELIPLKLALGLTSVITAFSLLMPGNGLDCEAFVLLREVANEQIVMLYFMVLGLATMLGLYKSNKIFDTILNTANIITWTFVSIGVYVSMFPFIPAINSAYTMLSLMSIWVYTRSNIRY
jgi:hypothetical protein